MMPSPHVDRGFADGLPEALLHERRLYDLLAASQDGVLMISAGGDLLYGNLAAERLFGRSGQNLAGVDPNQLIPGLWPPPMDQAGLGALAGTPYVIVGETADGALLLLSCSWSTSGQGADQVTLVLLRDETERQQAESRLRESSELLQGTLDALSAHLALLSEDGTIIAVNRTWRDFARHNGMADPTCGVGSNYLATCEQVTGDDADVAQRVAGGIRAVLSGHREEYSIEYTCHSPYQQRWFNVRVTRFIWQGRPLMVAAHENVTSTWQANLQSQASDVAFQSLIEALPDGIVVARGHQPLYANRSMARILGLDSVNPLLEGDPFSLIHPEDLERLLASPLTPGPEGAADLRVRRSDGTYAEVVVTSVPITMLGEALRLSIVRDVSEQRILTGKMQQMDRLVAVGTMAAGVGHEINNPLAYVCANLDFLGRELTELSLAAQVPLPEALLGECLLAIGDAQEGAARIRQIVSDMKHLARADQETLAPTDLHRLLDSTLGMAMNEIRHRALLEKDFQPVPLVLANASRLGQVFLNLLINAAQAISEGDVHRQRIRLATRVEPDGTVVVAVGDTGQGMSKEVRERIFDPFYTTKPLGVGTGLGLSICHSIVHDMGGDIRVISELGLGSTFEVRIPPTPMAEDPGLPVESPRPASVRRRLVLVDDEPKLALALARQLRDEYSVATCHTAAEALTHLLRVDGTVDAILCDLMMPDLSGMAFHQAVQAICPDMAARIIFFTGGAFTQASQEFLLTVANPVLDKPLDLARLRQTLASLLHGR